MSKLSKIRQTKAIRACTNEEHISMNLPIEPFDAFVNDFYLMDESIANGSNISAKVVAMAAYQEFSLCFHVLVQGNYLYSDLPITSLLPRDCEPIVVDLGTGIQFEDNPKVYDLIGPNCPTNSIETFVIPYLKELPVTAYSKNKQPMYFNGQYMFSVDFIDGNELVHIIKFNDYFGVFPNHKCTFNSEVHDLPKLKKNRAMWKRFE